MKTLVFYFIFIIYSFYSYSQEISHIMPDIGVPSYATKVEVFASYPYYNSEIPYQVFGDDGYYSNNENSYIRLICKNQEDNNKITISPLFVSWNGSLITTQIFVHNGLEPNSSDWRELNDEFKIPLSLIINDLHFEILDTFYIIKPQDSLNSNFPGVLGSGGNMGIRSPRGAMIFENIILDANGIYTISNEDCDPILDGNQGYLPVNIISLNDIFIGENTILSVSSTGKNAGVGGGGGGAGSKNGNGGNGFTSGGYSCYPSTIIYQTGESTGNFIALEIYDGNLSLNGILGASGSCDQGGGGGTGHPFGMSGSSGLVGMQPAEGGYGGASAGGEYSTEDPPTFGGGGGGNATNGEKGGGNTVNNGGKINGNSFIIPIYGGSGGGAGNVWLAQKGGNGGGGGGGISLHAYKNFNNLNKIIANGGDGSNGGVFNNWASPDSSSGGGGGSGGNIIIGSKISHTGNFTLEVNGGIGGLCGSIENCNNSFDGGDGGDGRIRIDGNISGNFNNNQENLSFAKGLTTDTIKYVGKTFILNGTGNGNPIHIYVKSQNTNWTEISYISNYSENWQVEITLPGDDEIYFLCASQDIQQNYISNYSMEAEKIFSQTASNILFVNREPVANNDTVNILENETIIIDVQNNDFDINGDNFTTEIIENPIFGEIELLNFDSISYIPNENFNGLDSFFYKICDNFGLCDSAKVLISVTEFNYFPEILDENGENIDTIFRITYEEIPLNICVNVIDLGDDILDVNFAESSTGNGEIELEPYGDTCFIYYPNENFNGFDTLIFTVCDENIISLCDTAFVVIEVIPVNDFPQIVDDENNNLDTIFTTIQEDFSINICLNIYDLDNENWNFSENYLSENCEISFEDNCVIYSPNENFNGLDSVLIFVCDEEEMCDSIFIFIDVLPTEDFPEVIDENGQITDTLYFTIPEDSFLEICPNFLDIDGDQINITNATSLIGEIEIEILCFTYFTDTNFVGIDSLEIIFCDDSEENLCNNLIVIIEVTEINDIPNVVDDDGNILEEMEEFTNEDSSIKICLNFYDLDENNIFISENNFSQNGEIFIENDSCFIYFPNENFNGIDALEIIFCDDGSPVLCDTFSIIMNVFPQNDTIYFDTYEDTNFELCDDLFFHESFEIINNFENSQINEINDSCFLYIPNEDFNGSDNFIIGVCKNSICDTVVIFANVIEKNDPPIIVNTWGNSTNELEYSTPEETPKTICISFEDESENLIMNVSENPNYGNISITEFPCFIYTPSDNFTGTDIFEIVLCDDENLCDTVIVYIEVTPVNHPPIANNDVITLKNSELINIDVLANDEDEDGDSIYISYVSKPVYGEVGINENGTIFYAPDTSYFGQNGEIIFNYEICDDVDFSYCNDAVVKIFFQYTDIPIYIPNSFSPNNDAINDFFVINGIENSPNNVLTVINRWGNIVFKAENYNNEWAGTYDNGSMRDKATGDKLPDGTYFFIFEARDFNIIKTGYIILKK